MKPSLLVKLVVTFFIFFILDRIYLHLMSEKIIKQIEKVQKEKIEMDYNGVLFLKILMIIALYLFIIEQNASLLNTFFLCFIILGSINATNMGIFRLWKSKITLIDTFVGGFQTLIAVYLARQIV